MNPPRNLILYNKSEFQRLHLHFYHPTTTQLMNLIRRAQPQHVSAEVRRLLEQISNECDQCQEFHASPLRFRVALPPDSIQLNADVAIDLVLSLIHI